MRPDPHVLYEAAVQGVAHDLALFTRIYKSHRGVRPKVLREDFCGTAALACAWVLRSPEHSAYGVDRDARVLAWARRRRLPSLGLAARRVTLVRGDVRRTGCPPADLVCAMNFSYWVFKRRADLLEYFRSVRRSLRPRGVFICNAFGGTEAMEPLTERTRIPASQDPEGRRVPSFTYLWEHARFNPIDHAIVCYIHFRLSDGTEMRRAFRYDWRFWTLPELSDTLKEAGFRDVLFYIDAWDERRNQPAAGYTLRRRFKNQLGWIANLVALR